MIYSCGKYKLIIFIMKKDNQLATFNTKLINQKEGFVIRKNLLDQFLQRKNFNCYG